MAANYSRQPERSDLLADRRQLLEHALQVAQFRKLQSHHLRTFPADLGMMSASLRYCFTTLVVSYGFYHVHQGSLFRDCAVHGCFPMH